MNSPAVRRHAVRRPEVRQAAGAALLLLVPAWAGAADFDGATLSLAWMAPFVGVLLSIALWPLIAPRVWHHHFGKIALAWAAAFVIPFASVFGVGEAFRQVVHAALAEYLPFVVLLFALYTVSGGIGLFGRLLGSPRTNVALLTAGALLANVMGTTGAAMVLVRPLIRANRQRRHNVHVLVFFIFIVANAGGTLTPLGDPPLFLGFLNGVSFFWTTRALLGPMLLVCGALLTIFYLLDRFFEAKGDERPGASAPFVEGESAGPIAEPPLHVVGGVNVVLLAAIAATVLASGFWRTGVSVVVAGTSLTLQDLARDVLLVGIAVLSLRVTPEGIHEANGFNWGPMQEVAKLFAAIFVTIVPAIAILKAGDAGALAALTRLVTTADGNANDAMYFWLTGILSSFLDNAPTYLVFFNLAGADASALMRHGATLTAISAGAVFMGALSYVGNAPNFMVRSIAEDAGIRMPSFFGYLGWSMPILLPLFAVLTWLFFR